MEEAEKMMALKKAYAEIILNTAKEAAARVMLSEKKALCFQQDLSSTKDEALRMLLRFKNMFDAKSTEAEFTSFTQKTRIEELEAQLNEAEGMILDLRAELGQVHDQLDKLKNNHVQQLTGLSEKDDMTCCESTTHEKKLTVLPITLSPQVNKFCNSTKQTATLNSQLDNLFVDDPNLSSVIMKSQEPELYRNGCTQRIRAIERNLVDGKLTCEDVVDQHIKNDSFVNEHEHNVETCKLYTANTVNMDVMKKPAGSVETGVNTKTVKDQLVQVCKMARKTRYGKAKTISRRSHRSQPLNRQRSSLAFSRHEKNFDVDHYNDKHGDVLLSSKPEKINVLENVPELDGNFLHKSGEAVCVLRRSLRKRKSRYQDDADNPFSVPSFLSRCKKSSVTYNVKTVVDCLEIETEAEIKQGTDPLLASRDDTIYTKVNGDSKLKQQAGGEDSNLITESRLISDAAENLEASADKLNLELDNTLLSVTSFDTKTSEATNGTPPSHADRSGLLRYTFSRKGKKNSLTIYGEKNSSLGKSFRKMRAGEMQKSCLVSESSEDSRRVVQVAQQLISLSGKRWQ